MYHEFDEDLEQVILELPAQWRDLLEEVPLVVEDEPPIAMVRKLGVEGRAIHLCGVHWGVPLTRRSVHHGCRLPDQMRLFRGPIRRVADQRRQPLISQIRVTLLHEMGHHFGLGEDDLSRLGYA